MLDDKESKAALPAIAAAAIPAAAAYQTIPAFVSTLYKSSFIIDEKYTVVP